MDITHYRRSETLARQVSPSWRQAQMHRPHTFIGTGFPVQVDSTADLLQLLDTMQEGRFVAFQRELGGLDEADLARLVAALADYCRFFGATFHATRCDLPLATMLAHDVLHRKLAAWPCSARLLEIGPGCGYLSFFVARDPRIVHYAQIETTESFYLLQHLVNRHCFGDGLVEHAAIDPLAARPVVLPHPVLPDEPRVTVALPAAARCHHWPWWRIGDLAAARFDLVTSNANLTEMSDGAVRHYAQLIGHTLETDGAVVVQDMGGGALPHDVIFRRFEEVGLVPIMVANPGTAGRSVAQPTVVLARRDRRVHRFDAPDGGPSDPARREAILPAPAGRRRMVGAAEIGQRVQALLAQGASP